MQRIDYRAACYPGIAFKQFHATSNGDADVSSYHRPNRSQQGIAGRAS